MTPDEVMGMVRTGHLTPDQALVHIREQPGMGPIARMIIEKQIAQRGTVYQLPGVVSAVRPLYGPDDRPRLDRHDRPYPHDEGCDRKHQPMTPCRPLHEERPGWHSLAELNPDGTRRQPTVIGECKGCLTSQVLDDYRLCSYCRELADLKAAAGKVQPAARDAYAWPWPLSVRGFLGRFWLVFALLAIGALIGVLG